jgi:ABC-type antimicrobial peptide transport system permease subunit
MYVPASQTTPAESALLNTIRPLSWTVLVKDDHPSVRAAVENEFRSVDGIVDVGHFRSMNQVLSEGAARQQFDSVVLAAFGTAALLVALIGIYGLTAFLVGSRTSEMGVRVAVGATAWDVVRHMTYPTTKLTTAGVALGLGSAYLLKSLVRNLLFGVSVGDPATFVLVPAALEVAALVAACIPARKAWKIEPSKALRS